MPRVRRIRVEVETEDADGVIAVHTAEGTPLPGLTVARIEPDFRTDISRSQGVLRHEIRSVRLYIEAVLGSDVEFHVLESLPDVVQITELPGPSRLEEGKS